MIATNLLKFNFFLLIPKLYLGIKFTKNFYFDFGGK